MLMGFSKRTELCLHFCEKCEGFFKKFKTFEDTLKGVGELLKSKNKIIRRHNTKPIIIKIKKKIAAKNSQLYNTEKKKKIGGRAVDKFDSNFSCLFRSKTCRTKKQKDEPTTLVQIAARVRRFSSPLSAISSVSFIFRDTSAPAN